MGLSLPKGIILDLARHGETVANVEKRFQGMNDTPLTAKGRREAHMVAAILASRLKGRSRPHFVSSPLPRARTTMEIILEDLHLPRTFDTDARLMEIDLGDWAGLTEEEARALDPGMFEARTGDKWNVRVPGGGENYAMVARRIRSFIADLSEDTVAISHAAVCRIFRGLVADLSWQEMSALDEPQDCVFELKENTLTRYEYEGPPLGAV